MSLGSTATSLVGHPAEDRLPVRVLVELNAALHGWSGNSRLSRHCSQWAGVTCNHRGLVTAIDLSTASVLGSLPSSLSRLAHLTYLNIGSANITGIVEGLSWISSLTNLNALVMAGVSSMEGDLSALTFLTSLKALQSL
ncbi:unnamed protein product [Closterium sp. NIES-64]|nr:unnamed protein product [Closterium sp. NIES-64]